MNFDICKKYCKISKDHVCVKVPHGFKASKEKELFCFYDLKNNIFNLSCQFQIDNPEKIKNTLFFKITKASLYDGCKFNFEQKFFELTEENK